MCEALKFTKYNLEGQRYISTRTLTAEQGNPLTIRLIALDKSFEYFQALVRLNEQIRNSVTTQIREEGFASIIRTRHAATSQLETNGAPIEEFNIPGEDNPYILRYFEIQYGLYEYFTNFGSTLDRLAYELDKFYELTIPKHILDWNSLLSRKETKSLEVKNSKLFSLIKNKQKEFNKAIRYRNRLIHDGIINFEVQNIFDKSPQDKRIVLRDDPDDEDSKYTVDAIQFCNETRINLISLLDRAYELMLKDIDTHKEEPYA